MLNKDYIPGIIRQILSLICHLRKFDVLHGGLLPENIYCFLSHNEGYIVKLRTLKYCSSFVQKDQLYLKTKRQTSYYSPIYERNSFLVPDLIALCLLTLELYTGIEPSVEDVLSDLEKE